MTTAKGREKKSSRVRLFTEMFYKWIIQQLSSHQPNEIYFELFSFLLSRTATATAWSSGLQCARWCGEKIKWKSQHLLTTTTEKWSSESERKIVIVMLWSSSSVACRPSSAKSVKHNHKSRMVNEIQMHTQTRQYCWLFNYLIMITTIWWWSTFADWTI